MKKELIKNTLGLKVLTDDGYKLFAGISIIGTEKIYRVDLEDNLYIECSLKHKLLTDRLDKISVEKLNVNDLIATLHGNKKILKITDTNKVEPVYDLIEVDGNHRYYTNDILSSNCEFISSDETLISSSYIHDNLKSVSEIFRIRESRWYKEPAPNHVYAIALDPSMGTGGDFSAIEVFDLTTMEQIAEWKSNTTPTVGQVKILLEMLFYIYSTLNDDPQQKGEPEIYWSVENNACGEGTLVAIQLTGLENFPGTMINDSSKRNGMTTTMKTKNTSCSVFKRLIEKGKLKLYSGALIAELKNFVAYGQSYAAKIGEHDDLVMATLLIIRIYNIVSKWEDNVIQEDDIIGDMSEITIEPMPISFL